MAFWDAVSNDVLVVDEVDGKECVGSVCGVVEGRRRLAGTRSGLLHPSVPTVTLVI